MGRVIMVDSAQCQTELETLVRVVLNICAEFDTLGDSLDVSQSLDIAYQEMMTSRLAECLGHSIEYRSQYDEARISLPIGLPLEEILRVHAQFELDADEMPEILGLLPHENTADQIRPYLREVVGQLVADQYAPEHAYLDGDLWFSEPSDVDLRFLEDSILYPNFYSLYESLTRELDDAEGQLSITDLLSQFTTDGKIDLKKLREKISEASVYVDEFDVDSDVEDMAQVWRDRETKAYDEMRSNLRKRYPKLSGMSIEIPDIFKGIVDMDFCDTKHILLSGITREESPSKSTQGKEASLVDSYEIGVVQARGRKKHQTTQTVIGAKEIYHVIPLEIVSKYAQEWAKAALVNNQTRMELAADIAEAAREAAVKAATKKYSTPKERQDAVKEAQIQAASEILNAARDTPPAPNQQQTGTQKPNGSNFKKKK